MHPRLSPALPPLSPPCPPARLPPLHRTLAMAVGTSNTAPLPSAVIVMRLISFSVSSLGMCLRR